MTKYIFVTGGVVSGLVKGITSASLGNLLKARGLSVVNQKLDPYINVDPDTMNPFQHGEVFVMTDGSTVGMLSGFGTSQYSFKYLLMWRVVVELYQRLVLMYPNFLEYPATGV